MKTIRNILVAIIAVMCFIGNISQSLAAGEGVSITNVTVMDTKNISAMLDKDINVDSLTKEEVKVMHDITVSSVELDVADAKRATVVLASELRQNTKYNLISVFGMDGSMDFEIGSDLIAGEKMNVGEEGIKSINIIDSRNLEVVYFDAITGNELELKLLEDMNITNIKAASNTMLEVTTEADLEKLNNYIFMLLSVDGIEGTELEIENGIYDFETGNSIIVASTNVPANVEINEPVVTNTSNDTVSDEQDNTVVGVEANEGETEVDLNAAAEGEQNLALDKNIEEVAASAEVVPATGTATSLLILLTIGLTAIVRYRRKK